MASKRGEHLKGTARKPQKKGNNSKHKRSKTNGSSPAGSSPGSRASQVNGKKKQSNHAPPWQIVNKKDIAKNLKAEKARRKRAKEGIHSFEDDRDYRISKSFLSPEDKALLAWRPFSLGQNDQIDFVGAYLNKQLPPRLGAPEVAFLGRSNVGKSSLLNKLVGSAAARVGKTPGATASVNLYGVFRKDKAMLGLVDLPGFGYAKLSKEAKESVQIAAENYLGNRRELAVGILLVDVRRVPSHDDRAVLAALYDMGVPIVVVATKMDKLSKNQLDHALQDIQDRLGLPEGQPLCVSSVTGTGLKNLWKIILEACEDAVEDLSEKLLGGARDDDQPAILEGENEIAYSQGYDWVHASVMYEADEGDFQEDKASYDLEEDQPPASRTSERGSLVRKETLKDLRKRARKMEIRGEL